MTSSDPAPAIAEAPLPRPPRPAGGGEDPRTFGALGSPVRLRILDALASEDKAIVDLSRSLGLHRVTLRYHLNYLLKQGLVEEVLPSAPKGVGRPAMRYRASRQRPVPGYPPRHFEIVGQVALAALVEAVGPEAAQESLRRRGVDAGRALIDSVVRDERVDRWTPEAFETLILGKRFRDLGIPSKVLSRSARDLEFRQFSCPFLELAEEMPSLVCDALDEGFHAGIGKAIGGLRTERIACMGHGDRYCQYRLTWEGEERARRKAKTRQVRRHIGESRA